MAKVTFNKEYPFTSPPDLNLRKKPTKCYSWSITLYVAETWILRIADQKYLDSSEMWCWWRMGKTRRIDHVKKWRSITQSQGEKNILLTLKRRKNNWTDHILRRNCFLKHVAGGRIDGRIQETGEWERSKQGLCDFRKGKDTGTWKKMY